MGTSLVLAMAVKTAIAQEEGSELEAVIVTGSLIRQANDLTSPVPLTVVTPEALENVGVLEITQAFRELPEFANGFSTETNIGGGGLQGLDMRYLGLQRTLVLVNGRRMSGFSDAVGNQGTPVDIGMIPQSLIGGIEVVRDGAGPTYGSDAVSGVVNFLLDERFEGFSATARYGMSARGEGGSLALASKMGFGNERGHIVIGADYMKKKPIWADTREFRRNPITEVGVAEVIRSFSEVTPAGRIYGFQDPPGPAGRPLLACYPLDGGANVFSGDVADCPTFNANAAHVNVMNTGNTIRDVGALGHYDITDNITFKGQFFYTNRYNDAPIGGYSLTTYNAFGLYPAGFNIPATSSANPFGQDIGVRWLTLPAGRNDQLTDVSQLWSNFGFEGRIAGRWDWDVMLSNSRTYSDQIYTAYPISSKIRNLFIPELCELDVECSRVGAFGNLDEFFAGGAAMSEAQANYGWFDEMVTTVYSVQQLTGTISGPIVTLPAGELMAALGYEYKRTTGQQSVDPITPTLDSARTVLLPWDGAYSTREGYAEIQVPLLKDLPGAKSLDLNAQVRYTSFDAAGTVLDDSTTWKVGMSYAVNDSFRFRASYGTSFRAPTPFDLYRGGGVSQDIATDPCRLDGIRAGNPVVDANCIAAGSPNGPPLTGNTLLRRSGGSPGLQPEKGKSYTIGAVLTPTFFENFTATVDYYNVKLTDGIRLTNLSDVLQECYTDPNFSARVANVGDLCYQYDLRNPDGSIGLIAVYGINVNEVSSRGIDFSAGYNFPSLGKVPGSLSVDLRTTRLLSAYDSSAGTPERRGTFNYPNWKGSLNFAWRHDQWSASWSARFIDAMVDTAVSNGNIPTPNVLNYSGTGFYWIHDLNIRWAPETENWGSPSVTLGVNNVLDKDPPFVPGNAGTLTSMFDMLGQYFFLNLGFRF
ncbi:MAG: TonB-dependent receptor [Nevskiaceae bacterium]|nr:TonB-dependent receptor [Nevskiaceae bacterium]